MATAKISFTVSNSNLTIPLNFQAQCDHQVFFSGEITDPVCIAFDIDDAEYSRELKFILNNKKPEHTEIDEQGNIIKDALLSINNCQFDSIDITTILNNLAVYQHDFNGTQKIIQDKFYGHMGCNGTVTLKFQTPIYLWLLEHI